MKRISIICMKRIIILVSVMAIASLAMAEGYQVPRKGFRGFVDLGYARSLSRMADGDDTCGPTQYEMRHDVVGSVSTAYGYQFNSHYFLGGGFSLGNGMHFELPLYVDTRYDFKFKKFTPFADFKIGYVLLNHHGTSGLWFSPTIGYRFNWGRMIGLNVGIGFTFKDMRTDKVKWFEYLDEVEINGETFQYSIQEYQKVGTRWRLEPYWTIRVGIDFR